MNLVLYKEIMKTNKQNNSQGKVNSDSGFVYIMFFFFLPVFIILIGLVIDSANLYSAHLKANAAAEKGLISAILSRINEKDTTLLRNFSENVDSIDINEFEEQYLETRAVESIRNNLVVNSVISDSELNNNISISNTNRSYQILSINSNLDRDVLTATVNLRVPTLFVHFTSGFKDLFNRESSRTVLGQASARIKAGNYIFLLDLSDSQACPAGIALNGGIQDTYCRCNSLNKVLITLADGSRRAETCQEEADRVPPPLTGIIRAQLTRDSLIRAISRLDSKRDRISVIGFHSVAFPIVNFRRLTSQPDTGLMKARHGFNPEFIIERLQQIKSLAQARDEFDTTPKYAGDGNADPANPYEFPSRVPIIVPEGNTNISDAFLTALQEAKISGLSADQGERFDIVYYSDGASTAMRGNIEGIVPPSYNRNQQRTRPLRNFTSLFNTNLTDENTYPQLYDENTVWSNDLINYQVVLSDGAGMVQQSMGPFVDATLYKRWYIWNLLNIERDGVDSIGNSLPYQPKLPWVSGPSPISDDRFNFSPFLLPDCHCGNAESDGLGYGSISCNNAENYTDNNLWVRNRPYIYNKDIFDLDPQLRQAAFARCFTNTGGIIEIQYPTERGNNSAGGAISVGNMFSVNNDFRNLYYIATMQAADLVRRNGGRIHAIGYGAESPNINDPIQGLDDVAGLKASVMANLASAYDDINSIYQRFDEDGNPIIDSNFSNVPRIPSGLYPNYRDLNDRRNSGVPSGTLYRAPDAEQFESFLTQLIAEIKMSIIEVN